MEALINSPFALSLSKGERGIDQSLLNIDSAYLLALLHTTPSDAISHAERGTKSNTTDPSLPLTNMTVTGDGLYEGVIRLNKSS